MVDHYNLIITLTLILPMFSLLTMAQTSANEENLIHFVGLSDVHSSPLASPMDRISRFYRRLNPALGGEWEIRPVKSGSRLSDPSSSRLETMSGLINQFDNQRANLVPLLGNRGLNNWKREGAETYKNMFLGVRG